MAPPPPAPSSSSTKILELNAKFSRLEALHSYLKASIGQDVLIFGGVTFESLRKTTQWLRQNLPSGEYHLF